MVVLQWLQTLMVFFSRFQFHSGFGFASRTPYGRLFCSFKHPVMTGREPDVASVLGEPVEIRRSRSDKDAYLFYRLEQPGRWLCVVAKHVDDDGFVITSYPTDAIKIGERVWTK